MIPFACSVAHIAGSQATIALAATCAAIHFAAWSRVAAETPRAPDDPSGAEAGEPERTAVLVPAVAGVAARDDVATPEDVSSRTASPRSMKTPAIAAPSAMTTAAASTPRPRSARAPVMG